MLQNFKLIVISSPTDLPGEANNVVKLFENGLAAYHLRKPLWQLRQAEDFLSAIPEIYHTRIVIHSNFSLLSKYPLKGIHLNEENKRSITLFKNHPIISTSFHSWEDITAQNFPYEYIFLSPVFDSISKSGYKSSFNLSLLETKLHDWHLQNPTAPKIIALGGITPGNMNRVQQYGFSGAAVIGAIWNESDPITAFNALQKSTGS